MTQRHGLSHDAAAESWDVLVAHVEKFVTEWESTQRPPTIDAFAPVAPVELRRLTLAELVKVDLEYRWKTTQYRRTLEDYLQDFPELSAGEGLPVDLIYEEFHIRQQAGDLVVPHQYYERFPERQDQLRRLMATQGPDVTTSLVPTKRIDDVHVGDRVDDFDLLLQLGKGAFATVFLARQRTLQRLVALKVSADKGSEPQTLAQLDHPHIVRVYDQRSLPEKKMRLLYMQYVPGGTLQDAMKAMGQVPRADRNEAAFQKAVNQQLENAGQIATGDAASLRRQAAVGWAELICRLGAQLAEALDYAHQQGVLHRDVKPANVLLGGDGRPKLADFNISFSSQIQGSTPAAYFGGSLAYMSPEQLEACNPGHDRKPDSLDGRSDLYSLAVLLWELLHDVRPFQDEYLETGWSATLEAMAERRRAGLERVPSVALYGPFAEALQKVLGRCLAADPDQRHANGRELARDLLLCLQPRARELLGPPEGGWRYWAARFPIMATLAAVLLPNAAAGVFNYFYNWQVIIQRLDGVQKAQLPLPPDEMPVLAAFEYVQLAINGIAFPLGAIVGVWYIWPLLARLHGIGVGAKGARSEAEQAADDEMRRRALHSGPFAAGLGICEWLAAGVAYPVALHVMTGVVDLQAYVHFAVSMTICGLIAAAYPFFLVTLLAVRVYYPHFLHGSPPPLEDEEALAQLKWMCNVFLIMAAAVPMAGVIMLTFLNLDNRLGLVVLSGAAGVGFALAFYLNHLLQSDIAALLGAMAPLDTSGSTTTARWTEG